MDLFGRKAKKQLDEYAILAANYVKLLQDKINTANNRINLISIENENLSNEVIQLKLKLEAATPKPVSNQPLYLNENEEDIEYAYRNELINKEQYEDMLRQLEFDNTNITFDLEAY